MTLNYTIAPLGPWLEPLTDRRRGSHLFRATWSDTLQLLERELVHLDAAHIVVQIDVTDGQIRQDGTLRATARVDFPGVRLSFASKHGPLTYCTDAYETGWAKLTAWQANLRAIALALEALRAVDRYGVSSRGEQYRGWTAIASRPAEMTAEVAAGLIAQWAEPDDDLKRARALQALLRSPTLFLPKLYRRAAQRAHPDRTGGDPDTMARINAARDILERRP